jgi:hypothetical protein
MDSGPAKQATELFYALRPTTVERETLGRESRGGPPVEMSMD